MGSNKDEVQHTYRLDGKQGLNEIAKLQLEYNELSKSIKKLTETQEKNIAKLSSMKEGTKAYEKLDKSIKETSERLITQKSLLDKIKTSFTEETKEVNLSSLSVQQLKRYLSVLQEQYFKLSPSQENFIAEQKRLQTAAEAASKALADREPILKKQKSFMESLKGGLPAAMIGGVAGAGVGVVTDLLSGALDKASQKIDELAQKSDALADLQVAFQTTAEDAKSINTELTKIDTRSSVKQLREITTAGGLLNVPREELQEFIKQADQAVVVMAKDFPGGVEETTTKLGKLKELYAETKALSFGDAIRKDASAIKTLSDNGTATAGWLTNFATTMGRVNPSIRPTLTQILGLGAAFEEAGFNAETAATNLSKTLAVSAKNTGAVAQFFGTTRKEVEKLINTKPNEFLLEFAQKLSKLDGTKYAQTLDKLKLGDAEVGQVLGVLGSQIDNVRQKQELANASFESGTRIAETFNIKNETFAANLEKLGKNWKTFINESTIGNIFSNMTSNIVKGMNDLLATDKSLSESFTDQTSTVKKLDKEVKPLLEKYDKLSKDKSAESQAELKKVLGQVIAIMPNASFEVDQYGRAISLNTSKTREFIEQQRAMLLIMNKGMIDQTADKHVKARQELTKLSAEINRVQTLKKDKDGNPIELTWDITGSNMVTHDIKAMNARALELRGTINSTYLAWKGFKGETVGGNAPITPPKPDDKTGAGLPDDGDKKAAEKAADLAKDRIDNAEKVAEEIDRINIAAIDDESAKKKATLEADLYYELQNRQKLVAENKMLQSDLDSWYTAKEKALNEAIAKIDTDAIEKQAKADQEIAEKVAKTVLDTRLQLAEASGDKEQILFAKIALRRQQFEIDIEKATAVEKQAIYEKYLADISVLTNKHQEDGAKERAKKQEESDKAYFEEYTKLSGDNYKNQKENEKQSQKDLKDAKIKFAENVEGAVFSIVASRFQKQENEITRSYDKQSKALETQKANNLITEEQYTLQKAEIDKQYNKKIAEAKRKQAIFDKAQALTQIAIDTAVAVMKITAQTGVAAPFTIPLIIGAGLLQAAAVIARPIEEVPAFFDGGRTSDTTKKKIPVNDGKGGFEAILHDEEYVVPEKVTSTPFWQSIEPIVESMRFSSSTENTKSVVNQNTQSKEYAVSKEIRNTEFWRNIEPIIEQINTSPVQKTESVRNTEKYTVSEKVRETEFWKSIEPIVQQMQSSEVVNNNAENTKNIVNQNTQSKEYSISKEIRNTEFWRNIEPVIEQLKTSEVVNKTETNNEKTSIFAQRLPLNNDFSAAPKNNYTAPQKVRNTKYFADIQPIVEQMRTSSVRSFDLGSSRTQAPQFSSPSSSSNLASSLPSSSASSSNNSSQAITLQFPPEMLAWFAATQAQKEAGLHLSFGALNDFKDKLNELELKHNQSLISKTPNSL